MANKDDDAKKLDWSVVDPESIKNDKVYAEYKAAQKLASEKREAFEAAFIEKARKGKKIAATQTLRFSYKFGRLSVAIDALSDKDTNGGKEKSTFKL